MRWIQFFIRFLRVLVVLVLLPETCLVVLLVFLQLSTRATSGCL
jgi:hypothetical protein